MLLKSALAIALLFVSGCVTMPQSGGSGAGYAGDRVSVGFDEVVVTVPSVAPPGWRNLHVGLAALINPRQASLYAPYEVRDLVERLQARVSGRLVEVLVGLAAADVSDLARLRQTLGVEAQTVLDQAMASWTHADEYEIRTVVVSLYFTDGSVGRTGTRRPGWW